MMFAMPSAAFACFLPVCTLRAAGAARRKSSDDEKGRRIFLSWKKVVVDVSVVTIDVSSTGFGHRLVQNSRNDSAEYISKELGNESTKAAYLPIAI